MAQAAVEKEYNALIARFRTSMAANGVTFENETEAGKALRAFRLGAVDSIGYMEQVTNETISKAPPHKVSDIVASRLGSLYLALTGN